MRDTVFGLQEREDINDVWELRKMVASAPIEELSGAYIGSVWGHA